MDNSNHTQFLREAIQLSLEKMEANAGGPFGALIVRQGKIIGRGWNRVTSTYDPTAHAEINAIREACAQERIFSLAGCDLYTSCEPCPLCLAAIYWSRLDQVFYAASCDDAATAGFDDRKFYEELSKPPALRCIPMHQSLRGEAQAVLNVWQQKCDRIPY
jgi:tRNA(Arg) A34 adenosine deaminase TadA